MPKSMADTTPGRSDCAACLLSATCIYFNSPSESTNNLGQVVPNLNHDHSDPMMISSTYWSPHSTDWWHHLEEMHSQYVYFPCVVNDIFSIRPHGHGVVASFSVEQDVIGWRQLETTGKTLPKKVLVCQISSVNDGILAGNNPVLDTTGTENVFEMKRVPEERIFHRMAKVHDFLKIWQGSQNLYATQKESRIYHNQITAVGYISVLEEIVKASWSNVEHDGAAAFKLSERLPLPQAFYTRAFLKNNPKY